MHGIAVDPRQIPEEHLSKRYTLQHAYALHRDIESGWLPRKMTNNENFKKSKIFGVCHRSQVTAEI